MDTPAKGDSAYTNAVDVWALGCVTFQILAKSPPFPNVRKYYQYCENLREFPKDMLTARNTSSAGVEFITRLVAVDVDQRFTVEQALQHDWLSEPGLKVHIREEPPVTAPDATQYPESTPMPTRETKSWNKESARSKLEPPTAVPVAAKATESGAHKNRDTTVPKSSTGLKTENQTDIKEKLEEDVINDDRKHNRPPEWFVERLSNGQLLQLRWLRLLEYKLTDEDGNSEL